MSSKRLEVFIIIITIIIIIVIRTPVEFELTPYEILMDDIRSRRYKLNKVRFNHEKVMKTIIIIFQVPLAMPQRVKREAHDVILDFIRSRPPLKPVRFF